MTPHWLACFAVEDVEAALKAVDEGGGTRCRRLIDVPSGHFAVVADPQGAVFAVVDGDMDDLGFACRRNYTRWRMAVRERAPRASSLTPNGVAWRGFLRVHAALLSASTPSSTRRTGCRCARSRC